MSEPDMLTPLSERVSGPFKGCFVATYAVAAPGGFVAYAKLCGRSPENVWCVRPSLRWGPICRSPQKRR